MKRYLIMFAVLAGAFVLSAQTGSNFGLQTPAGALSNCPTPVTGTNTTCSGPDGFYIANGANPPAKVATVTASGALCPTGTALNASAITITSTGGVILSNPVCK